MNNNNQVTSDLLQGKNTCNNQPIFTKRPGERRQEERRGGERRRGRREERRREQRRREERR